ncbi:ADP-ribose pyrophosphatase [Legionella busanensis]|uniref:ADP-ribose pyrophosphatase n=1 Tax=Legionella busanensis TaxID=190655 RepID=A0A378JKY8_9GAMM|nr:NUDIX domain-containing protein [Legionella busanensis]STX51348.1 ADP-ribose pyrophosphatase [Legionella busanensis]
MNHQAKIIKKLDIHKGYLEVAKYDFEVSSLSPNQKVTFVTNREVVKTANSVSILLYIPSQDSFIFCQQFRPGVFLNSDKEHCFTLECVAGTIDNASDNPEQTACREVKEETGIEINELRLVAKVYKSPGLLTEMNYLFFAKIETPPQGNIHGVDDEEIVTHVIKREKAYELMNDLQIVDAATLIMLNWFRANYS